MVYFVRGKVRLFLVLIFFYFPRRPPITEFRFLSGERFKFVYLQVSRGNLIYLNTFNNTAPDHKMKIVRLKKR